MSLATRPDGRRPDELRQVSVVYEGLARADGSARFGFGQTQSLASVSGPLEVRLNLELPSQATVDVQIRPLPSLPGTDSKALATNMKTILSPSLFLSHHPRTLVQIVGQALCSGGTGRVWNASLIASLVNASSAALINSGSVPMKGVVCAVAVGRLPSGPDSEAALLLDPSEAELPQCAGIGCFAYFFSSTLSPTPPLSGDIPPCSLLWTNYTSSAPFDAAELASARELAEQGAREVWKAFKESLSSMGLPPAAIAELKASQLKDAQGEGNSPAEDEDDDDDAKVEI